MKVPFFVPRACPDEEGAIVALNARERVYITLDEPTSCVLAKYSSIVVLVLIVTSSIAFVLETVLSEPPVGCVVTLCGPNGTSSGCEEEQLCAPVPMPFFA